MSNEDTAFLGENNDDTNYEAWLREHALDTKVIGGGSEEPVSKDRRGGHQESLGPSVPATPTSAFAHSDLITSPTTDAEGHTTGSFSVFTIFFVLLALFGIGYYTYYQASGATTRIYSGAAATSTLATTTIGLTLTPDNLQSGLINHFTFDGPNMDWASSTAEVVEVVTKPTGLSFTCGTDTVTDADANVYDTLLIGSQCWMKQNLRVGTRISVATTQTNNSTIEKWCYGDSDANCTSNNPNEPDGGLYQWNEAMQYSTTPGARGICPAGWHIPTDTELYTMENYLDSTVNNPDATGYRGTDIGTKLKPNGTSGFEFNLAGYGSSGSFFSRASSSYLWSSSESGGNAWYRSVFSGNAQVGRGAGGKTLGLSVRCLQDTSTDPAPIRGNTANITQSNATIGKVGQGLAFNGTNASISAGDISDIDTLTSLSVCAWVKHDSLTSDDAIVSKEDVTGGNGFILFRDDVGASSGRTDIYSFTVFDSADSDTTKIETPSNGSEQNNWTHVCGTYQANNADGLRLYINGVGVADNPVSTVGISAINGGTYPLTLGARSDATMPYHGALDDVRIYNRALTAAEVAQLSGIWLGGTIESVPIGGGEPSFTCGVSTVEDADANVYDTLLIGSQCWMKQNMRVGTRVNIATTQTNNSTIEKWCYSNSDANCTSNNPNQPDGGLYQWNEAMQYSTTPGAQGICPAGWHIPTHDELTTLERAVCTTGSCATDFPYDTTTTGYRGTTEGTKLKPSGSSGFEFNLAGIGVSGSFVYRASDGYLWSSSESGGSAWYRLVFSGSAQVLRVAGVKAVGLSVRCLQD